MLLQFIKMHGAGNDFVVLDNRNGRMPVAGLDMQKLADRQFGIGCDQVVILERSDKADIFMRIRNADGQQGWRLRLARFVLRRLADLFRTRGFNRTARQHRDHRWRHSPRMYRTNNNITIDMGKPRLEWKDIPLMRNKPTRCI